MPRKLQTTELPVFHISINGDREALCGSADLRGLVAPRLRDVLGDLMCPACCTVLVRCEQPPTVEAAVSGPIRQFREIAQSAVTGTTGYLPDDRTERDAAA